MNDAPFLDMSEYDFRSKCVAFECHGHGFAREVIVRDDRESTDKSKIRGAERPLGAQLVLITLNHEVPLNARLNFELS